MDGIANHFPAKLHYRLKDFADTISTFTQRSLLALTTGALTQKPISAWLASVPTVPVLRNDHWL